MRWLLAPLLFLALAVACGDGGQPATTPSPTATAAPTVQPTSTPSPVGTTTPLAEGTTTPSPEGPMYIALGDSLSAGVGASDPAATAFVPLLHQRLGEGFELLNLGHSGDTSQQLLDHGHLEQAIAEIQARNGDDDPDNDVRLVTLEIGGNDLLDLFFELILSGTCPSLQVSLEKPECVDALDTTLREYGPNLESALSRLQEADPDVPIVLITLYNLFSGSVVPVFAELAELSMEGIPDTSFPEGMNDIMRAQVEGSDVILVDIYPLFEGRAPELIASDFIHPNDEGYRVIAEAIIDALGDGP